MHQYVSDQHVPASRDICVTDGVCVFNHSSISIFSLVV